MIINDVHDHDRVPAHNELGTCRTSLVLPKQSVFMNSQKGRQKEFYAFQRS